MHRQCAIEAQRICAECQAIGLIAGRDAEIARLRAALGEQSLDVARLLTDVDQLMADLAAHKRALAAGPAALRVMGEICDAELVEAAQERAIKGGG